MDLNNLHDYNLLKNISIYGTLVKNKFDWDTFEYQMKHGANVQNNGNDNISSANDLQSLLTSPFRNKGAYFGVALKLRFY